MSDVPLRQAASPRAGYNDRLAMAKSPIALTVFACLAFGGPVQAQSGASRTDAQRHFEQGLRLYNVQSYEEAIVEFKAGYQLDPRPQFLYALGQAQRMNHQCKAAIVSYEAFLRTAPAAKQEAAARDQIAACHAERTPETPAIVVPQTSGPPGPQAVASPIAIAEPAPSSTAVGNVSATTNEPADRTAPLNRHWWFWAMIGGGVAAGLVIAASAGAFTRTMNATCPPNRDCLYP
jgi:hypothetical protein